MNILFGGFDKFMYTIVEVGGTQWKMEKGINLQVPKLDVEAGKKVEFDKVLMLVDKDKIQIGNPLVKDVVIKATVVSHGKDKKVRVFKKKRRKGYKVLRGHRQDFTEIKIDNITVAKPAAKKTAAPKKEAAPKAAEGDAPKKATPKKTAAASTAKKTTTAANKAPAKKTATKTAAAKKPAAKKIEPKAEEK